MSEFEDSITVVLIPGLQGMELVELEFHYGQNPLDLIGAPEPPRRKAVKYSGLTTTMGRMRHLDPYLSQIAEHFELRFYGKVDERKLMGPTTLMEQCWSMIIEQCRFVPVPNMC